VSPLASCRLKIWALESNEHEAGKYYKEVVMRGTKHFSESLTVRTAILVVLVAALKLIGVIVTDEEILTLTGSVEGLWDELGAIIAMAVVIYGRFTATKMLRQ
tara:strand:- start:679 stop:987 length:309 start_codon:yes stop_codon:yes gene_type:complete